MLPPSWTDNLRRLYWFKRSARTSAARRQAWRRIAAEKKRLLSAGVDYLELHLWCRHLTAPDNPNALARLERYYVQRPLFEPPTWPNGA